MKKFNSNGKLLITGEYLILDGALSLAAPCKLGQSLIFIPHQKQTLNWKSYDVNGKLWFESVFKADNLEIVETSDIDTVNWLKKILLFCFKNSNKNFCGTISCHLDFPNNWGLGSSSSLINNISQLYGLDPFEIHFATTNGSGYDIACANSKSALTYQLSDNKPVTKNIHWDPDFKNEISFIFLNKKQNSYLEIKRFQSLKKDLGLINEVSELTKKIIASTTLKEFEELIDIHEKIIGNLIGVEPVKKQLFSDYNGSIKSLGAWGGDFIMATKNNKNYFLNKGYHTIIPFNEIIKKSTLKIAS